MRLVGRDENPSGVDACLAPRELLVESGQHDVFVELPGEREAEQSVARWLARSGLRAVAGWAPATQLPRASLEALLGGCVGAVADAPGSEFASAVRRFGLPLLAPPAEDAPAALHLLLPRAPAPRHAFMALRIHDDFALVRDALRCAVEAELGMPCVHFEDRRIVAAEPGVRQRTLALIRGASFFVADLSYSASCPAFDSPNTAHEIGFAQACGLPLLLCAQAPRRNLYFSAGDLDTLFWRDEADLHVLARQWLAPHRVRLGARVIAAGPADLPASRFEFDARRAYEGPPGPLARASRRAAALLGLGRDRSRAAR